MLASVIIQFLKNNTYQNVSKDWFADSDWILNVNMAVDYVYGFLNSREIRPYCAIDETLTPFGGAATGKDFRTTYTIQGLIKNRFFDDGNDSSSGVLADTNQELTPVNFLVADNSNECQFTFDTTGIIGIKTSKDWSTLRVKYKRGPVILEAGTISTASIDLPNNLMGALINLCLWKVSPPYLENGQSLANGYYQYAIEELKLYAKNIGLSVDMAKFSA